MDNIQTALELIKNELAALTGRRAVLERAKESLELLLPPAPHNDVEEETDGSELASDAINDAGKEGKKKFKEQDLPF